MFLEDPLATNGESRAREENPWLRHRSTALGVIWGSVHLDAKVSLVQ